MALVSPGSGWPLRRHSYASGSVEVAETERMSSSPTGMEAGGNVSVIWGRSPAGSGGVSNEREVCAGLAPDIGQEEG